MFGPLTDREKACIARLPVISRARESHLYGQDGSNWLDCWADGGRALAGHRPNGVTHRLKNELERGLYAPYPNKWTNRLGKALMELFPGYDTFRVFADIQSALQSAASPDWPTDPALPDGAIDSANLWGRPLLPDHPQAECLFPILPVPGCYTCQPVLYKKDSGKLPPSDPASPLILAALTRSCNSLKQRGQTHLKDSDIWKMRGPYMIYCGPENRYPDVFEQSLTQSILIPPSPQRPGICPMKMTPGEIKIFTTFSH